MELSAAFNVDLQYRSNSGVPYVAWARYLVENTEHGNTRRFLQTLVASLVSRGREGVASTNYEKREHHQSMVDLLSQLETELQVGDIPSELSVPESSPFTAKSESREFFEKAETEITIVDNWVGIGTLDCLRNITQHVRIITGQQKSSIGEGLERTPLQNKWGVPLI